MDRLTPKQKKFTDEYLIDFNATRAYLIAYPKVKKEATAAVNASKLLRNAKIQKYINEKTAEFKKKALISKERVLQEFANIAFADITDLISITNGVVIIEDTDDIPKGLRSAISSVKETKNGIAVQFHDKNRALENIARHLGMYVDKVEHSGSVGNPILESINNQLKNRKQKDE